MLNRTAIQNYLTVPTMFDKTCDNCFSNIFTVNYVRIITLLNSTPARDGKNRTIPTLTILLRASIAFFKYKVYNIDPTMSQNITTKIETKTSYLVLFTFTHGPEVPDFVDP